eukprot:GILK01009324.1.p1 GENE.GILK01009324.1~~GILK01009324.1.p1  ORF type:complete len:722 (+),score=102.75 GILK01009324.1:75-2240(+)
MDIERAGHHPPHAGEQKWWKCSCLSRNKAASEKKYFPSGSTATEATEEESLLPQEPSDNNPFSKYDTSASNKFPEIRNWIASYSWSSLLHDTIAGVTVAAILIPQAMAYAHMAGLPPLYGVYSSFLPLLLYPFFGSSRHLSIGPVAVVCILIQIAVTGFVDDEPEARMGRAVCLSLLVGIILIVLGLLKVGFLENVLSHPLMCGFLSAVAMVIIVEQMQTVLAITLPHSSFPQQVYQLFANISDTKITPLIVSAVTVVFLALLLFLRKMWFPQALILQCGPLIVTIVGTIVSYYARLDQHPGLHVLGRLPAGLSPFGLPQLTLTNLSELLPDAMAIALVGYVETLAVAKAIATRQRYDLNANTELLAFGICNLVSSFFTCFPSFGALSRSPVNELCGAKTQLAGFITGVCVGLALLFIMPYLYYLPVACIAATVIVSVVGVIELREAVYLWRVHKLDFGLFMLALFGTLIFGVSTGIMICIGVSLLIVLKYAASPYCAMQQSFVHGHSNDARWASIADFCSADAGMSQSLQDAINKQFDPESLLDPSDVCHCVERECLSAIHIPVIKVESALYFANIQGFRWIVQCMLRCCAPTLRAIMVDGSRIVALDSTAIKVLVELADDLQKMNILLRFAQIKPSSPVHSMFVKSGFEARVGPSNISNNKALAQLRIQVCAIANRELASSIAGAAPSPAAAVITMRKRPTSKQDRRVSETLPAIGSEF